MKYSFNWLKELSGTKLSAEKAAELLTMKSMEVEGVEKGGSIPDGVVVGKILEIKKHPNADKLQLVRVDIKKEILNIVCGAWNIKVGDLVPVAQVGTVLPGDFEIKEVEIRGENSFGMLCAQDELGLGEDHSGIIILPKNAKIGEKVSKYLGSSDTIIEIKVLPDRAHDCLSHVGVAREIAVLENKPFDYDFDGLKLPNKKSKILKVDINDKKLCPRYIGAVMTNVEIKSSPSWMQDRLKACGIKAINNVVDATNYVMLELGNPLHAFELEKFKIQNSKGEIIVRRAKKNEKMMLLDESEVALDDNDLLITDGEKPLALAGIMGGKDSGISDNTRTIVLEAANFNSTNIRRTHTRLGIQTESSNRFEKDLDPNLAEKAMVRIIEILEHTANAKLEGIVDNYPKPIKPWKINLELSYIDNLLGEKVPQKGIVKMLNSLDIITAIKPSKVACEIPTFRLDLRTQEDLIEEIGRIWGYEKIKPQPLVGPIEPAKMNEQAFFERKVRSILTGLGFDEMYNYSFYSRRDAEVCGLDNVKHYELSNPMNPDQELVRVSLAPGILKNVRENLKHFENFHISEIGRTYFPDNDKVGEKRMLAMASVLSTYYEIDTTNENEKTFYSLKGALEDLLENLGIKNIQFDGLNIECPGAAHPGRCAEINTNNVNIGVIAEINPSVLAEYKIKKRVAMVELDLEKLSKIMPKDKTYQPINKFPTVTRDISMIVPENVTYAQIEKLILKTGGDLVTNIELFDRFEARRSLAVRIYFNAYDRTLESGAVDETIKKIISGLEKELEIKIRK